MVTIQAKYDALKEILAELECEVCVELMVPPINMCILGHSYCHNCAKKMNKCPKCRSEKSTIHNYRLENIYYKMPVPCKNVEDGCKVEVKGAEMEEHQNYCKYTITNCPLTLVDNCAWNGSRRDIINHCRESHPNNVFCTHQQWLSCPDFLHCNSSRQAQFTESYWMLFQAHGEMFKGIWEINKEVGFMRWGMIYVGPNEGANRFSFRISFKNSEDDDMFVAACQPSNQGLYLQGFYILMHAATLHRICEGGAMSYMITIHKAGEEAQEATGLGEESAVRPQVSGYYNMDDDILEDYRIIMMDLTENSDYGQTQL